MNGTKQFDTTDLRGVLARAIEQEEAEFRLTTYRWNAGTREALAVTAHDVSPMGLAQEVARVLRRAGLTDTEVLDLMLSAGVVPRGVAQVLFWACVPAE
jgi:hypothetical protein